MLRAKKKHLIVFAEALLFAAVLFAFLLPMWHATSVSIFQARDLLRAKLVGEGQPIFFGPETQGSGRLPGGFYYYLIALPLLFGGVKAVWYFMVACLALTGAAIWQFFRTYWNDSVAAIALIFLFGTAPVIYVQLSFLNPSFLPLFATAILILLLTVFAVNGSSDSTKAKAWIIACALTGLAVQVHFTAIILFFTGVTVQVFAARIGVERLRRRIFVWGLAAFVLTFVPYFIWAAVVSYGGHLGQDAPAGNDLNFHAWGLFKKEFEWGLAAHPLAQIPRRAADFIGLWKCLAILAGCLICRKFKLVNGANRGIKARSAGKILLICMLFSFLPATFFLTAAQAPRYAFIFILAQAFLMAVIAGSFLPKIKYQWLLAAVALAIIGSEISFLSKLDDEQVLTYEQGQKLLEQIAHQYGWDYEKLRYSIVLVDMKYETSFRWVNDGHPIKSTIANPEPVDGFFIGYTPIRNFKPVAAEEWISSSRVDGTVVAAMRSGELKLLQPVYSGSLLAVPYRFTSETRRGDHFHNLGMPYSLKDDESDERDGTFSHFARFSNCDDRFVECRGTVGVEKFKAKSGRSLLRVYISEPALSRLTVYEGHRWTEGLVHPTLTVQCGEKNHPMVLAETLGFRYDHWHENHLRGPLERTIKNPCGAHTPSKIEFSYDSVSVSSDGEFFYLPGKTWTLSYRKYNYSKNQSL